MQEQVILIADGDGDARIILEALLRHAGYGVVTAADGERALALARAREPALVIAELYLAASGERCLVRALKRELPLAAIPVLVHTGHTEAADEEWALDAGCDGFMTKPCHRADLMSAVGLLASPARLERQLSPSGVSS
jgi:two-component system, cell cycle response regulator DivK